MNWKTRDGREIPVEKMDDPHLCNTMRMLERQTERKNDHDALHLLLSASGWDLGDAASDCLDMEINIIEHRATAEAFPIYKEMLAEATLRKLAYEQWCVRCQKFHAVNQATCDETHCTECGRFHPAPRNELHHAELKKESNIVTS